MDKFKKIANSRYVIYFWILLAFIVIFLTKTSDHRDFVTFRAEEIAAIQKIIHPEYYDGEFFSIESKTHNPYFNYAYIAAFAAKKFGYTENLWELGKIFWFFEKGLTILIFVMLCNYIFNKDKIILIIAALLFISFLDHEAAQKSLAMPLYFLAIYYLLKEKLVVSAIFTASIFYLHIGSGVWWLGTALFAVLIMMFQKKVSLRAAGIFCIVTLLLSSPIIYAYLVRSFNSSIDEFTIRYFYYSHIWQISPLLTLIVTPLTFVNQWLTFAVFYLGYHNAKKYGYINSNIMMLVFGALLLYFIQFIFADIFHSNFVTPMQLTRALQTVFVFCILFLSFLLASHIRNGNYIFFIMFIFLFLAYRTDKTFLMSFSLLIAYELFKGHIKKVIEKIPYNFKKSFYRIEKVGGKHDTLLQQPIFIVIFLFFLFAGLKFSFVTPLKLYIKSFIHTSESVRIVNTEQMRKKSLEDTAKFLNGRVANGRGLVLFPFLEFDFPLFITTHDSFITFHTPIYNLFFNLEGSAKFKYILENELNSSLEKLFENWDGKNFYVRWDKMWKNLNEDIIMRWKEKYKMTHVIRENELPLKFPVVYRNSFYSVYEIK